MYAVGIIAEKIPALFVTTAMHNVYLSLCSFDLRKFERLSRVTKDKINK